nr:MAG: hypothetical protein [Bacteriophage sp.]
MKLIDLLVQELPKRGGWPDGANYAVQDADGTVKFAKTLTYLHYLAGEWRSNENGFDWIYGDRPFDGNFVTEWTADDNHQAIISMARYECEISNNEFQEQSTNEWNGEGLPPVGCECEWNDTNVGWLPVTIKYISEQVVVMASLTNLCGVHELTEIAKDIICDKPQFRPLHTEADKKRERICDAIYGALTRAERQHNHSDEAEAVYDAIAAGKIPGVKLDD